MQCIFVGIIILFAIWGFCSAKYFNEKKLFYQIMLVLLGIIVLFEYLVYAQAGKNWVSFKNQINNICVIDYGSLQ